MIVVVVVFVVVQPHINSSRTSSTGPVVDHRSVDDLLSFINGTCDRLDCEQDSNVKKRSRQRQKKVMNNYQDHSKTTHVSITNHYGNLRSPKERHVISRNHVFTPASISSFNFSFSFFLSLFLSFSLSYVCVCVCVCARARARAQSSTKQL